MPVSGHFSHDQRETWDIFVDAYHPGVTMLRDGVTVDQVFRPLTEGTTIDFEPVASINGQGYFLEDMFLITKHGAELLTPGVPYSVEQIESAMPW